LGTDDTQKVTGVSLKNTQDGSMQKIDVQGVFIAIGHTPMSAMFKGQLDMDDENYLLVEKGTVRTKIPGVYAAGDVTDKVYRQAVTAAGMGCMAALDAEKFLAQ